MPILEGCYLAFKFLGCTFRKMAIFEGEKSLSKVFFKKGVFFPIENNCFGWFSISKWRFPSGFCVATSWIILLKMFIWTRFHLQQSTRRPVLLVSLHQQADFPLKSPKVKAPRHAASWWRTSPWKTLNQFLEGNLHLEKPKGRTNEPLETIRKIGETSPLKKLIVIFGGSSQLVGSLLAGMILSLPWARTAHHTLQIKRWKPPYTSLQISKIFGLKNLGCWKPCFDVWKNEEALKDWNKLSPKNYDGWSTYPPNLPRNKSVFRTC